VTVIVRANSCLVLVCEVLVVFAAVSDLVTGVCLGPTVTLGVDFADLRIALVFTATFVVGAMTGSEVGWNQLV
jgi:hypothetical protein